MRFFDREQECSVLKAILAEHAPKGRYKPEDLLTLWSLTGGVARYVEQFMDEGAVSAKSMLDSAFRHSSPILDEGKVVLIQEFGKDYGTYFSILAAVAGGRTSYGEIKNEIGIVAEDEIGKRLDFFEVKRDVRDIRLGSLESKSAAFFAKNGSRDGDWAVRHVGLSLKDI